jgi:hypothetical protein
MAVEEWYHPGKIPREHGRFCLSATDAFPQPTVRASVGTRNPIGIYCAAMRRLVLALNLTALLALAALADLVFYRIINGVFLPSRHGTAAERLLSDFGLFVSNLAGILALLLSVAGLLRALRSDDVFPRSMRITVSTVGLFFLALSGLGVLWILGTPRYHVHLRISHGFLVFFLALGMWHGTRSWRSRLGVTLFAIPVVIQAVALFCDRMSWSRLDPSQMVRVAHAVALAAMTATPVLLTPRPWRASRAAITIGSGILLAVALSAAAMLRLDLVQAVAFYGLHIDLTGLPSSTERLYIGALIVAFACLGASTVSCLAVRGQSRLVGWGLLLLAVAGLEINSPKSALFTLCGLLALAIAGARENRGVAPSGATSFGAPLSS